MIKPGTTQTGRHQRSLLLHLLRVSPARPGGFSMQGSLAVGEPAGTMTSHARCFQRDWEVVMNKIKWIPVPEILQHCSSKPCQFREDIVRSF
jgi:hypothetical protein